MWEINEDDTKFLYTDIFNSVVFKIEGFGCLKCGD